MGLMFKSLLGIYARTESLPHGVYISSAFLHGAKLFSVVIVPTYSLSSNIESLEDASLSELALTLPVFLMVNSPLLSLHICLLLMQVQGRERSAVIGRNPVPWPHGLK